MSSRGRLSTTAESRTKAGRSCSSGRCDRAGEGHGIGALRMAEQQRYVPKHKIRVVTAASLFDGHDAAINVMRRVLQASGAEVIHLGHNRSALEVAVAAVQEDAQAVAVSSYQGGHMEYFRYL